MQAIYTILEFWHAKDIELDGVDRFDGRILEISTDGGNQFNQVGNSLISLDSYDVVIDRSSDNPLAGSNVWCGDSVPYIKVAVNLTSFAGQSIQIRFRQGNDSEVAAQGWDIDDVQILGCAGPADAIFSNGFE